MKKNMTMLFCTLLAAVLLGFGCTGNSGENTSLNEPQKSVTADFNSVSAAQLNNESELKNEPGEKMEKSKNPAKETKVTFIELGSVNCVPCKMMQPIMAEIEKEYGSRVKVEFYDVWTPEGRVYGEKYRIAVIPTQVFLDSEGNEYYRHQGFFPKDKIVEVLKIQGVE